MLPSPDKSDPDDEYVDKWTWAHADQRIGGNPSQEPTLGTRELSRRNRGRKRPGPKNPGEAVNEWEAAAKEGRTGGAWPVTRSDTALKT